MLEKSGKGFSITALILGIVTIVIFWFPILPWITGIIAIIFGIMGIAKEKSGMAWAGTVTGALGIIFSIAIIVVGFMLFNSAFSFIEEVRHELETAINNYNRENASTINPILGRWIAEDGEEYLEFTGNEFRWFRSIDNLADDYHFGTYTYIAGALRHSGFDYGEMGSEIFTVQMTYLGTRMNGVLHEEESEGIFIIQRMDSEDFLWVVNQRIGLVQRFRIDRVIE